MFFHNTGEKTLWYNHSLVFNHSHEKKKIHVFFLTPRGSDSSLMFIWINYGKISYNVDEEIQTERPVTNNKEIKFLKTNK